MYHPEIRLEVSKLRREKGLTFKEIIGRFPYLSKGTISGWVRGIQLKPEHEKRILDKQLKQRVEFLKYNQRKHELALREDNRIMGLARKNVGKLSKRDLLIAGAALYWAEGHNKSMHAIEFANSNPKVILLMMRFLREILKIREEKFRCKMTIHPGINESNCLDFWSKLTGVSRNQFHKTWTKPPRSSTGKMHNILYNGTLVVRVCDVRSLRWLKGYIQALV